MYLLEFKDTFKIQIRYLWSNNMDNKASPNNILVGFKTETHFQTESSKNRVSSEFVISIPTLVEMEILRDNKIMRWQILLHLSNNLRKNKYKLVKKQSTCIPKSISILHPIKTILISTFQYNLIILCS